MVISFPLADVFTPAAKQLSVVSNQLSANAKTLKTQMRQRISFF